MHDNRTTGPGGPGPPRPVRPLIPPCPPVRAVTPREISRAVLELVRCRRALSARPTRGQLWAMARYGGSAPRTVALDPGSGWLPPSLPVGFPLGAAGLCFAHAGGGAMVALPDGSGFTA